MRAIVKSVLIVCLGLANLQAFGQEQDSTAFKGLAEKPPANPVLRRFKVEELKEFRRHYQEVIDRLVVEKEFLRKKAIQDLEELLANHPETPGLDKILLRLAELHYEQAVQDFSLALDEESSCCEGDSIEGAGSIAELPPEPEKDFTWPLLLFERLIHEVPNSPLVADALYNKGFVLEELGRTAEAFETYLELADTYPQSEYVADALMRMAEYHFSPPNRDIEKSIALYKRVLNYKESPLYDAALYRLGWANYTMSDYPEAIAYFTLLADDVDRIKPLDPDQKYHFPAVQDEAIEYIGISFLDFGGADYAAKYFEGIGGRYYGLRVLKKIGDSQMEVLEEHDKAIGAYEHLLEAYPEYAEAPTIQAKIAAAYRKSEDEQMAYLRRAELFKKYREGTEWWDKIKDGRSKEQANALARQAMQDNINFLFRQAAEKDDSKLYKQAIADSRDYLSAFPDDSSSALIHWNMALALDTKLALKNEAFDEYVKISNTYWDSKYQKQAAENAVALADEYIRSDSLTLDGTSIFSDSLAGNIEQQNLNPEEQKLVLALNNYIELFPHEDETAKMLAKAGSIHYNRHQFKESLKYFKTLAKHFPDSEVSNQARFTIMESYFGKGDYESSEIIAKRIKDMGPEFADQATSRLAESIFFQAKTYAESLDHVRAAEEYRRVVAEVPNTEFADVALYNSGLEFDKANIYDQAIQSYNTLIKTHPQSEHYFGAVNNLAFDYREIGNFRNAAETYERLADIDTSATGPQVALFNASVSYVQAEDWQHAIQVNSKFVDRFPQAEDADDLLFNNAQYYLMLKDLKNANRIYESFAQKYPDSPKAVEAFYHRGKYFAENDRPYEAKLEYDKAIKKHEALKSRGKEANDFYTSEALFQLAEIKFAEFNNIQFTLPKKAMAKAKTKKKSLLKELADSYTRVAEFGTIRVYESTYKIGSAYEEFAKSWAQQEISPMDDNQRVVARKEINQTAAGLYEKAIDAYKNAAQALEILAAKQRESVQTEINDADPNKLSNIDSTLTVAENWIKASKTKVSENLFTIAEIYNESLVQLLNVPIPPGMKPLEKLVYRQQVLEKAVAPIAKQVVDAHIRNLTESRELHIENQWTGLSTGRVFNVSTIVPDELQKLSARALTNYREKVKTYDQLVEADDEAAFDVAEELANLVDLGSTYAMSSANAYARNIGKSEEIALDSVALAKTREKFLAATLQFGDAAISLAKTASENVRKYEKLFAETDSPKYEDAQFAYDDMYFSLVDGSQKVLKYGYDASQKLHFEPSKSLAIATRLVKTDPAQFAEKLGFEVVEEIIPSSSSWSVSAELVEGWTDINFVDSHWSAAYHEGVGKNLSTTGVAVQAIWLTAFDESRLAEEGSKSPIQSASKKDSIATDDLSKAVSRPSKVYFRKTFEINGLPVSGTLELFADDTYKLFINGKAIPTPESGGEGGVKSHNLTQYLRTGKNVIAIEVTDSDNSMGNLESIIEIRKLPELAESLGPENSKE